MALSYKYFTSGGLNIAGSADNLASILHYYKFENDNLDTFGFFDLVGNNQYQAGILNNAVLTSKFSSVEGNANNNGAFYNGNNFTFCMWFKIGTTTKNQNVFQLKSPDQDLIIIYSSSDKKLYFNSLSNPISPTIISGTIWYFVSIVKIGSSVYVSLNNESATTYSYNYSPIRFNSVIKTNLDVISPSKYSALFWDDIRFYYKGLRSEEINYIYNNGKPLAISGGDESVLWDQQTHYYPFDNSVFDDSGNANLTLSYFSSTGGVSPIVEGKFGNALQIGNTYSLSSYLGYNYYGYTSYIGDIVGSNSGSYSISFWVKRIANPLSQITNKVALLSITSAFDENVISFGSNGQNLFKVNDGTTNGSSIELAADLTVWNHFVVIYNSVLGRYTFFLNGGIYGEIAATRSSLTAAKFYLGWDGVSYDSNFDPYLSQISLIDDLRIYNFAIKGWDALALYALGSFGTIEKSLGISFNLGNQPLKSYQIESYEFNDTDPNAPIGISNTTNNNRIILQQIFATDVNEVCKKIKELNFLMNIKSIAEWSNNLSGPYGGGEEGRTQYGYYTDINNFCENYECLDFCLGVDAVVTIAGTAYASSSNDVIYGKGGAIFSGSATAYSNVIAYVSSGSLQLIGDAICFQTGGIQGNSFVSNGKFSLNGTAIQKSSDQGVLVVEIAGLMNISTITPILTTSSGSPLTTTTLASRENICDCKNTPFQLQLRHNLNKTSELTRFASKNNLTIPSIVTMLYNKQVEKYVGNIKLNGISSFANANESWSITFTLYCTGELNQFANRYNWILNTNIRKSTSGFGDKETNIIVYLLSSYICPQFDGKAIRFKTNVNINTLVTQVNNSSFVNSTNINDRINLFFSDAWKNDPNFYISVGV